jgi:hypothetical protein
MEHPEPVQINPKAVMRNAMEHPEPVQINPKAVMRNAVVR